MCQRIIKTYLLPSVVLLFLLLLGTSVTCQASEQVLTTEQKIRILFDDSKRLSEINRVLQLNSTESQQELLTALENSKQLRKELAELKIAYNQLLIEVQKTTDYSKKQEELIKEINVSFEAYSKEKKAEIAKLKLNNKIKDVGLVILGAWAVWESAKIK